MMNWLRLNGYLSKDLPQGADTSDKNCDGTVPPVLSPLISAYSTTMRCMPNKEETAV
jgi:hypothetical protein